MMTPWLVGMVLIWILTVLMALDVILTHVGLALGGVTEMNGVMAVFYGWNIWLGSGVKALGSVVVVWALVVAFRRASYRVAWVLAFVPSALFGVYLAVAAWNIAQLLLIVILRAV